MWAAVSQPRALDIYGPSTAQFVPLPRDAAPGRANRTLPHLGDETVHSVAQLQQLALLQSLLARQAFASNGNPVPLLSPSNQDDTPHFDGGLFTSSSDSNQQPTPTHKNSTLHSVDAAMDALARGHQPNIFGLNQLPPDSSGEFSVTPDELTAAQASLDLWTSTIFNSASPLGSPLVSPSAYPFDQVGPTLGALGVAPLSSESSPYLDWSALYTQGTQSSPAAAAATFSLPPISTLAPSQGDRLVPSNPHERPSLERSLTSYTGSLSIDSPASRDAPVLPPVQRSTPASRSSSPSTCSQPFFSRAAEPSRRSSRANAGARGRAVLAGHADLGPAGGRQRRAGSLSGSEEGSSRRPSAALGKSKELMTPEEIEDDKRRRNTEASGASCSLGATPCASLTDSLVQHVSEQRRSYETPSCSRRARSSASGLRLWRRRRTRCVARLLSPSRHSRRGADDSSACQLTNENRWLRDIVAERAEVNPRVLDALRFQSGGRAAALR